MIKILTGKYQKHIAWLLFFVFYGELAVSLYASNTIKPVYFYNNADNYYKANILPDHSYIADAISKTIPAEIAQKSSPVIEFTEAFSTAKNDDADKVNIGGPGQPEMSTFKSVGADNMVNLFTGDFSYNINLLDIGGYPVNIFYNAGITMDQESSWVGLGWNINPGSISRNMRGLPDDYNGQDSITKVQSMRPDRTIGISAETGMEVTGVPGLKLGYNMGIFYNNRRGLGLEVGVKGDYSQNKFITEQSQDDKTKKDTTALSSTSLSLDVTLNSQNGMTLNPGFQISQKKIATMVQKGLSTSANISSREGVTDINVGGEYRQYKDKAFQDESWKIKGNARLNFARSSFTPSIRMPITTFNQNYMLKFGTEKYVLFKEGTLSGYIQESCIDPSDRKQKKPAYGFMYYEKATGDKNALMDFNRLNDGVYTFKKPVIDLPVYTYDVFTISGEGTGGSFRGYRGNIGYMRDNDTRSKTSNLSLTLDLGVSPNIFHGGTVIGGVYSPSFVNEWRSGNALRRTSRFNTTDSIYQSFYFKNPGETAIIDENYYSSLGDDKLIRPYLGNTGTATPYLKSGFQVFDSSKNVTGTLPVTAETHRQTRDKRSRVITYLTAEDATKVGLDKKMYSYKENEFKPGSCYTDSAYITPILRYDPNNPGFYRKGQHLSEIDVWEPDGNEYVYGIAAYQIKQSEVTFNTESHPAVGSNLVRYNIGTDNSVNNNKGRDGFYQNETMNGYAHSFLLTGILSPDYVDVKGDGITDDDLGTAIRFNYSRVNKKIYGVTGQHYWNNYKWRMPADSGMAIYNEGLKADKRDDKALYTYGEKELWYLHSIESKNMVATFYVTDRNDGRQVLDSNGRVIDGPGQKKLDKINLYTKADFLKYGSNARPIKTVYFKYSYKLCKNFNLNKTAGDRGKLTLDSLWFTFNGNNRQVKNKYVFSYAETVHSVNTNPDYNSGENDRWGNYKPHTVNPDEVNNSDYPYTFQPYDIENTDTSDAYASAWNLEKILLPGGAVINVQYEADDYAYVQNKRASQMTRIAGFGWDKNSTPGNDLYTYDPLLSLVPAHMDHRFVFFDVADTIHNITELREKYLQDFKQLLLKLWVKMPKGNVGDDYAYEPVTVYGSIKTYGLIDNNPKRFYIELDETRKGGSPIMETIIQFLKDHLPGRAYPGQEVIGDGALVQVVRSVLALMDGFLKGVQGFENNLKAFSRARKVLLSMSFARLNNPYFKKIGGGYRVKKVTVDDNWDKMTNQYKSMYGQVYNYTTNATVNRKNITISSGVATYEPSVGNEENPFREVLKYFDKQFLGPTDYNNVELPVAETFFPSPMVGYSKVTVRSIHHNRDTIKYKSAIGFQQTEFYTSKDFPVISDYTDFDNDSRHHHKPNVIERIFNFNKRDYMTLTQGFRVVLNDMNGKLKSQTSYAENDSITPVNYTANYYRLVSKGDNKYKLDNVLPVVSGSDGKITNKLVGKDIEVMNDFREHFSYTYSAQIPLNGEFFTVSGFPVFIPTIFRLIFRNESQYRSATTLKVVNEYGILDSVVNIDKGSQVSTKNLVYDAESGNVLLSRTNNEFDKAIYQFNYPAWWVHSGMEPAYRNIDLTYKGILFRNGRIEGAPAGFTFGHFESGDEIFVDHKGIAPSESPGCIATGSPYLLPVSTEYRIWAVDVTKDLRNPHREFIFIDRYGKPYNAVNATIRIIRSGKRNLTGTSAGSVVSLENPIRTVSGEQRIVIDSNCNVINAGVAEFKEKWRATDQFYAVDTVVRTVRAALKLHTNVYSDETHSFGEYRRPSTRFKDNIPESEHFAAAGFHNNNRDFHYRSWIKFNFTGFDTSNTILSADLKLFAHRGSHDFFIHKNAEHAACPDNSPFYGPDSHQLADPHEAYSDHSNNFILSRLFSTWPDDNDCTTWESRYGFMPPQGNLNILEVPGTSPINSNLNKSIPIPDLVRGMLRDKSEKNYATALKMELKNYSGGSHTARVCFWGTSYSPPALRLATPLATDPNARQIPYIDIGYYNCNLSNPVVYKGALGGAPPAPAADSDSVFCIADTIGRLCLSVFLKRQANPYTEGVLGIWRGWKSYVYYGERRDKDNLVSTDIRKDGVIKNFMPYWAFTEDIKEKLGRTGDSKWVWNSEITQYNRKGAELENRDPLGRYNAGIYGYQESLPVAVVNNSRLRQAAFDGFEDYSYQDDPCQPFCKPSKRHFNTLIPSYMIIDSEAHTGRYSVRVAANNSCLLNVKVSENDEEVTPDLRIKIDSIPYAQLTMITPPQGVGLKGYYYDDPNFGGTATIREDKYVNLEFKHVFPNICPSPRQEDDPVSPVRCYNMSVRWKGKIQVEGTGKYYFDIPPGKIDDIAYVWVNDTLVVTSILNSTHTTTGVTLYAGILYDIQVDYKQSTSTGRIQLYWKQPGPFQFVPVPSGNLYPEGKEYLADSTTTVDTIYCVKPDTIQAIKHHLIDSFNLIPNKKMVASVWMKKDTASCKCSAYTNNFTIKNAAGDTVIASFVAKENIIEGWQQFEAIFTIPAHNPKIIIDLKAPSDATVFIDDLRIHPFNANMKSFVYDPVTLRLSAELDENNYASFYEYDDDGGLVRVKKETKKGIKTITETRSAVQKNIKNL